MIRRRWLWFLTACLLLVGAGCRAPIDGADAPDLAAALADGSPAFYLRHAPGAHPVEHRGLGIELSFDNCAGDDMQTYLYDELAPPAPDTVIVLDELPAELDPFRGMMAALVREAYRLAGSYPPVLADAAEIPLAAQRRQDALVVPAEIWDENVIELHIEDATVAEVPVRVLLRVDWAIELGAAVSCYGDALDGSGTVPLILAMGRPLGETAPSATAAPTATAAPDACEAPLLDSPAQELVALYVEHLDAGDHASAYGLLAERYQLRLPYPQYLAGYEPLQRMALCSLETLESHGGRETLFATLRITLDAEGAPHDELWVAQYTVQTATDAPGAIASVIMYRAALHEE